MVSKQYGQNFILRLDKGELLVENVLQFVKQHGIHPSWVQGLGGALWAEIGFYDLGQKTYNFKRIDEGLEIASLTGNITWTNNQPIAHLHMIVADKNLQTHGGHLKEAAVAGTCEILLTTFNEAIGRKHDPTIGLDLLDI